MKCRETIELVEKLVSLPVRGAWVEIAIGKDKYNQQQSLPVRGAWVEI